MVKGFFLSVPLVDKTSIYFYGMDNGIFPIGNGRPAAKGQAKGYPIRANCWISGSKGPRNLLRHDHFTTLLLCDRAALHSFEDLSHFKGVIYFDEIAEFITPYPAIP